MKCSCCGEQLNKSIYKDGQNYKSCPKCSSNNGSEHVFYRYPERFGTTPARITPNNSDGAQSYCVECRGNQPALLSESFLCKDL